MPTQDAILFHPLQKPTSADLNDAQSLIARELADVARYMNATTTFSSGAVPATTTRNVVLNGLEVIPNGSDVSVLQGVLMQNSTSLPPTPGVLDSSYRIGINRAPETVAMPSPVTNSWALIEAQVVATTDTASVEFLNPATKNFAPVANTPRLQTIDTQFRVTTAAGTIPAFSGTSWVPIAAVFRPSGGGAVSPADIIDLRPMWSSRLAHCNDAVPSASNPLQGARRGAPGMFSYDAGANEAKLVAEVFTDRGDRLWFSGAFDPIDTRVVAAGLSFAANTWYYVYLAPFRLNHAPVNAQGLPLNTQARGLIIVSDVPPANGVNSIGINPPAPFDTSPSVIAGTAVCVAALRRNAGNTDFISTNSADGREFVLAGTTGQPSSIVAWTLTPPVAGSNPVTPAAGITPACADTILAAIRYDGGASWAGAAPVQFSVLKNGTSTESFGMTVAQDNTEQIVRVEIPRALFGSDNYDLFFSNAPNVATQVSIRYYGWRMR